MARHLDKLALGRTVVAASGQVGWTDAADVVVVGTGAAGYAAALTAAHAGASVHMLEKGGDVGGTTRRAGGGAGERGTIQIWIPNNALMRERGLSDPKPAALQYMARVARPHLYDPSSPTLGLPPAELDLMDAFYDSAATACDFLRGIGALRVRAHDPDSWTIGDYQPELPENAAPFGRALCISDEQGRQGTGDDLIRAMDAVAGTLPIRIRTRHRVVRIVVEAGSGRVLGVEAIDGDGDVVAFRARCGVVFGSGGFAHDAELRLNHLPGPTAGAAAAATSEGDFVRIARSLGIPLFNMNSAWWAPILLEHAPHARSCAFRLPGDSMLVVDKYGRRVVNEKALYNELARVFFAWDATRAEHSNRLLFMIYDGATARMSRQIPKDAPIAEGGGNPLASAAGQPPHEISAGTLAELAERLRERLAQLERGGGQLLAPDFGEQLVATVRRFDEYARNGFDGDFGRGLTPSERARSGHGRPGNAQNPTMYPLDPRGPFHAAILAGGMIDTKGGPRVDRRARILGADGEPVPGLYGAGNCVASPTVQGYWGPGATLGPALTFGYLAGRDCVRSHRGAQATAASSGGRRPLEKGRT